MPGLPEWIIIGIIGLLIFGKRLPEVGRSLGKGIVEFKKGLRGVEEDLMQDEASAPQRAFPPMPAQSSSTQAAAASQPQYKFDPYTGKPLAPQFDPYTGQRIAPENTVSTNQTAPAQPEHSQT
jgi:sec-independent protein translocase protein TatA